MEKLRKSMRNITESSRIAGGTTGRYLPNSRKNIFAKIHILFPLHHLGNFPRLA
jgi:hypothetical protein